MLLKIIAVFTYILIANRGLSCVVLWGGVGCIGLIVMDADATCTHLVGLEVAFHTCAQCGIEIVTFSIGGHLHVTLPRAEVTYVILVQYPPVYNTSFQVGIHAMHLHTACIPCRQGMVAVE